MVLAQDAVRITGLVEFVRALKAVDSGLPKLVRLAGNQAAGTVVEWARDRIEVDTGRAQRSIRATSTRTESRITGGGARVPYYPWLDFGGRVGPADSVEREFIKSGRYIYPGYAVNASRVEQDLAEALIDLVDRAGLAVDGRG